MQFGAVAVASSAAVKLIDHPRRPGSSGSPISRFNGSQLPGSSTGPAQASAASLSPAQWTLPQSNVLLNGRSKSIPSALNTAPSSALLTSTLSLPTASPSPARPKRSREAQHAIGVREEQLAAQVAKLKFELAAEKSIRLSLEGELPKLRELCKRAKQRITELVQQREAANAQEAALKTEIERLEDALAEEGLLVAHFKERAELLELELSRQKVKQRQTEALVRRNDNARALNVVAELFQLSCQRLAASNGDILQTAPVKSEVPVIHPLPLALQGAAVTIPPPDQNRIDDSSSSSDSDAEEQHEVGKEKKRQKLMDNTDACTSIAAAASAATEALMADPYTVMTPPFDLEKIQAVLSAPVQIEEIGGPNDTRVMETDKNAAADDTPVSLVKTQEEAEDNSMVVTPAAPKRRRGRPRGLKGMRAKLYAGPGLSAEELYPVPKDNQAKMAAKKAQQALQLQKQMERQKLFAKV